MALGVPPGRAPGVWHVCFRGPVAVCLWFHLLSLSELRPVTRSIYSLCSCLQFGGMSVAQRSSSKCHILPDRKVYFLLKFTIYPFLSCEFRDGFLAKPCNTSEIRHRSVSVPSKCSIQVRDEKGDVGGFQKPLHSSTRSSIYLLKWELKSWIL